ncbi:hypothetical protein [Nocardia wallacei]|uniref:hypothetical protein n=1 Tax=Nocardia wallacei TaxID=480035 RepID=UPI002454F20D|nr:hypothetical protein [Nocardia wallacei]
MATGINTILRTLGGALGAQLAVVIVANSASPTHPPTESGHTAAFMVSATIAALAVLAAAAIPSTDR